MVPESWDGSREPVLKRKPLSQDYKIRCRPPFKFRFQMNNGLFFSLSMSKKKKYVQSIPSDIF
jgi:hypothetical protein